MNITSTYSVIPLIGSVLVILLGFFIWLKKPSEWLNLLFFFCNITIAIWLFGSFSLFNADSNSGRLFAGRFIYIGLVFLPIFLYHFGLLYGGIVERQKNLVVVGYLFSFIFLPLSQASNLFVSSLTERGGGVYITAHLYHHLFLTYFYFFIFGFLVNLFKQFKESSGNKRSELKFVLIGYSLLALSSPLAFLPAYGLPLYPLSFLLALPFAVILAYAIIKYQALNLKIIAAEIIAAFLNIFIVVQFFFPVGKPDSVLHVGLWIGIFIFSWLLMQLLNKEIALRNEISALATSLKSSNIKLEESNWRLQQLDKQKTEFLTIAAHQLRTPLSIIKGYVSLLTDGTYGKLSAEVKTVLSNIDDSNQWLISLSDELLDIASLEQGKVKYHFGAVDVRDLMMRVLQELTPKAEAKNQKLIWLRPTTEYLVKLDTDKIHYVIFNFVDNAIKYSQAGDINLELTCLKTGVEVRIIDHGVGFNKNDSANFFQKFYRGQNVHTTSVNSTGLGLYVCGKIIKAHGGRFWAKSKGLNKGSEFGFFIPNKPPTK